jgi:hypothetical protein
MSDLRNLLLDCRSALRRANRHFDDDPLRQKIDDALIELGKNKDDDELAEPETRTAQQVAYAWQIASRSVKLTHPDLYEKLSKRVHDMLDTDVLHDPATEFLKMEAKLETAAVEQQSVVKELADLRQSLAKVVPLVGRDAIGSDAECTQRRIQILVKAASQGAGLPKPVTDNPIDLTHTREELQAVVLGQRALSRWERSWCLAEAMVMSNKTADQLKKMKDNDLVKLVLAGPTAPSPAGAKK